MNAFKCHVPLTETVLPSPGGCGLMCEETLSSSQKYVSKYVISTILLRWQSGRLPVVNRSDSWILPEAKEKRDGYDC